jgi:hypothetical protein
MRGSGRESYRIEVVATATHDDGITVSMTGDSTVQPSTRPSTFSVSIGDNAKDGQTLSVIAR